MTGTIRIASSSAQRSAFALLRSVSVVVVVLALISPMAGAS
jgi:hypothetical protein